MRTIATTHFDGQFPVTWIEESGVHHVTYGAHTADYTKYRLALANFLACQRHSAACAGIYDDEDD